MYTCPMHPKVVEDKPGICSECGMNLVPMKGNKGEAHSVHLKEDSSSARASAGIHAGHNTSSLLVKFWITLALTIPIFFYSEMAMMVFKIQAPQFFGSKYLLLIIGSIIFFYCGWIFVASAYRELRAKLPGMMTLIAIAIMAAYLYSFFSILSGGTHDLLFELSSLIAIMLLGHWIEMRSVKSAQGALRELAKLLPEEVEVLQGSTTKIISLRQLSVGDIVVVKPGGKIPADGRIVGGTSDLNESIITGESKPILKKNGDTVIAGSTNGDSTLKIEIEKVGENTFLSGIKRLVADAQSSKSRMQMLSDRAAFYLTIVAIVAGAVTFIAWLLFGSGLATATERLVAVLVITCPHALGLAVPLVASISTTVAARNGLLVKERRALESARKIDVVLFDKTGTLTKGEFGIDTIIPNGEITEEEVLRIAASVNRESEHLLAKAIVEEATKRNIELSSVRDFYRIAGKGARGNVDGVEVYVGNIHLVAENNIHPSSEYTNKLDILSKQGKTVIHVIAHKKLLGSIALVDVIRDESRDAIKTLKALGVKTAMVTGDSEDVAKWVAKELGVEEYFAGVMPGEKAEKVRLLQKKGWKVAMVGDGVNDAPALAEAQLGIAIGAGTNVAIESAGIILVRNDPRDIPKIFNLSRLTYRKMVENLFWATGYNVVAIPLAAGALAFKGVILEPWLAAVMMSASTVIVALNAVLLKRKKL